MYKAPRGTSDQLPSEQKYWSYVQDVIESVCMTYGFDRINTPIFESTALFARTVGDQTDVVQKEMYTFDDRGGESLTLRPEGTAPVCRAYLEHGMHVLPQPVRVFYFCPIFRYERPQAGRFRQHNQFGVEAIGDPDPLVDAEVIQLGWDMTTQLGLKKMNLVINSIGDSECRPAYLEALKSYYAGRLDELCKDCHSRFERNPLRLLDCKEESCAPFIAGAPESVQYLCENCKDHWDKLRRYLKSSGLEYVEDHRLVRGLDYYTRTVFEIKPQGGGSQSTVLGGGRYDGLIQQLGGPVTPGVGFGCGVERLIANLKEQTALVKDHRMRKIVVACLGDEAVEAGILIANELRGSGISSVMAPRSRSLKSQMRYASNLNARFTIIIGQDEIVNQTVLLRDMDEGSQKETHVSEITNMISSMVAL